MKLEIITPKEKKIIEGIDEIYFPTDKGPLGILPGYDYIIFSLSPLGVMKYKIKDKVSFYALFGGVVKVKDDVISLLSEMVEEGSSIDLLRAKESEERARKRIIEKKDGLDIARAQASLSRALLRQEVKSLSNGEIKDR